ncbi:MAG: hypothetical protein ACP5RC_11900 [Halothiobacillaceae bacterium]
MKCRQWYYAQLRWAVMVEGKQGLREWKEAVHIFLSDDREAAFQQALLIGRMDEDCHEEGRRLVESRLAEVVRLDCLGVNQTDFRIDLGPKRAKEKLPFEHIFHPEETVPEAAF